MTGDLEWQTFLDTEAQVRFVAVGGHRLRPVEVGAGEDVWVNPRYARRLSANTGADLTVVAQVGHLVQQARPEIFNATVLPFLGAGR